MQEWRRVKQALPTREAMCRSRAVWTAHKSDYIFFLTTLRSATVRCSSVDHYWEGECKRSATPEVAAPGP